MDTGQLPREITPPGGLEDETVAHLRRHGYLPRRTKWWPQLAAAVVIFAMGVAGGVAWTAPRDVAPGQPRFLLLLQGGSTITPADEARVVASYRAWATALAQSGRFVAGERLGPARVSVPAGVDDTDPVQGYFIVSASDLADAVSVAKSAPHVQRGGRITVRPIDTP